ncbi:hypothetical protein HAX54_043307 [Datura stramonium]|uniref:Uncharacterized protein n=1 Tax=Datura stramonium TaxID=4076 RepID=A0ABS8SMZ4_DATST|nr:hypothetical protein [Datura stramonium]
MMAATGGPPSQDEPPRLYAKALNPAISKPSTSNKPKVKLLDPPVKTLASGKVVGGLVAPGGWNTARSKKHHNQNLKYINKGINQNEMEKRTKLHNTFDILQDQEIDNNGDIDVTHTKDSSMEQRNKKESAKEWVEQTFGKQIGDGTSGKNKVNNKDTKNQENEKDAATNNYEKSIKEGLTIEPVEQTNKQDSMSAIKGDKGTKGIAKDNIDSVATSEESITDINREKDPQDTLLEQENELATLLEDPGDVLMNRGKSDQILKGELGTSLAGNQEGEEDMENNIQEVTKEAELSPKHTELINGSTTKIKRGNKAGQPPPQLRLLPRRLTASKTSSS